LSFVTNIAVDMRRRDIAAAAEFGRCLQKTQKRQASVAH